MADDLVAKDIEDVHPVSQVFWFEKDDARRNCPCLFLDRDGVIVEEVNYLHRREDVRVLAGAAELIAAAQRRGFAVGVITNQAGIGRGLYDWAAFVDVQDEIVARLGLGSSPFDFVAACASHPAAVDPFQRIENHSWRKPNAGMLKMAASALDLDLASSVLVGDQLSDIAAGAAAGIGRMLHVSTGHGRSRRADIAAFGQERGLDLTFVADLMEAARQLGWFRTSQ